jgi:hypothetical protein
MAASRAHKQQRNYQRSMPITKALLSRFTTALNVMRHVVNMSGHMAIFPSSVDVDHRQPLVKGGTNALIICVLVVVMLIEVSKNSQ